MSGKMTSDDLIQQLSTIIDPAFARAAVEAYSEMEMRFVAADWGPAELDGGRLCEAVARCLLQFDTGIVDHTSLPGKIEQMLVDNAGAYTHKLTLKDRQHVTKVIGTVYKLRNDRGVAHISATHSANAMDAMFVLHAGKWIFAELLRLLWNGNRTVVGEVIEQLVQLEHAIIHELEGKPLVLVKGISAPDEVLVLLNHAPNHRMDRADLRVYARQKPQTVSTAVSRLIDEKDVRPLDGGKEIALTPKGQKRVREVVLPKLRPKT